MQQQINNNSSRRQQQVTFRMDIIGALNALLNKHHNAKTVGRAHNIRVTWRVFNAAEAHCPYRK